MKIRKLYSSKDLFHIWQRRWGHLIHKGLGQITDHIIDHILPPRCPASGTIVTQPGGLSAQEWIKLDFLSDPCCPRCGFPFEISFSPHQLCASCDIRAPTCDHIRATLHYNTASRPLLLKFKHGDRTDLAPVFARWMARAGAVVLHQADYLIPVPLHQYRLWQRRYNQAALLAYALSHHCGLPIYADYLKRKRNTAMQGYLSSLARYRNVKGAFIVPESAHINIKGAKIVLIDDVFTTGATLNECAEVLKNHGAAQVDALCLARVIRPLPPETV